MPNISWAIVSSEIIYFNNIKGVTEFWVIVMWYYFSKGEYIRTIYTVKII